MGESTDGDGRRNGRGSPSGGFARRRTIASRRLPAALLGLGVALGVACDRGRTLDDDAAKAELKALERLLADTADLERHPELSDGDIDPLRLLRLRDPRVERAREACVRQYEAIAQWYEQNRQCKAALDLLQQRVHDLREDAADPAALVAEAERACVPAVRFEERVTQAQQECDREIGRVRQALGLPR
ncbi:MAG: hypothetical protein GYA57_17680 [Myxococcales bacterium]|nr:hypothetical protein [Myxococcales bacterium]